MFTSSMKTSIYIFLKLLLTLLLLVCNSCGMLYKVNNAVKWMWFLLAAFCNNFIMTMLLFLSLIYNFLDEPPFAFCFFWQGTPSPQPWVPQTLLFLTGRPQGTLASWAAFLTHWMDYKKVLSKSCSTSLRFACSFCSVFADKPDWFRFKVIGSVNADKASPSGSGRSIGCHIAALQRLKDSSIMPEDTFALEWWWTRFNLTLTMTIFLLSLSSCQYQFVDWE